MNIKNRLKKLEIRTENGNDFCSCFRKYLDAQIRFVYSGESFDESKFDLPENDYCPKCRKQVSKRDANLVETIIKSYGFSEI